MSRSYKKNAIRKYEYISPKQKRNWNRAVRGKYKIQCKRIIFDKNFDDVLFWNRKHEAISSADKYLDYYFKARYFYTSFYDYIENDYSEYEEDLKWWKRKVIGK
jgi:hypothetical protein